MNAATVYAHNSSHYGVKIHISGARFVVIYIRCG